MGEPAEALEYISPRPNHLVIVPDLGAVALIPGPTAEFSANTSAPEFSDDRSARIEELVSKTKGYLQEAGYTILHRSVASAPEAGAAFEQAKTTFGKLVEETKEKAAAVATATIGFRRVELIDEALGEAYKRAFKHLVGFRGDAKFETWLYRTVINACKDAMKREAKHAHDELNNQSEVSITDGVMRTPVSDPEHVALQTWQNERLKLALDALSDKDRQVLLLKTTYTGYTFDDIAKMIGGNGNALKTRYCRALPRLKEKLAAQGITNIGQLVLTEY